MVHTARSHTAHPHTAHPHTSHPHTHTTITHTTFTHTTSTHITSTHSTATHSTATHTFTHAHSHEALAACQPVCAPQQGQCAAPFARPRPPHLEMRPASPGQGSQAGGGEEAELQDSRPIDAHLCRESPGARMNISTNTPRQASWKPTKHGEQRTAKAASTSPQSK